MGFQFNYVGGGTKTRRPIILHMKYDPHCEVPCCQFNYVGGGTKTRRQIILHMKYDPHCEVPCCRLVDDVDCDGNGSSGRAMSLSEIQAFIEAENMRLEQEPSQFSVKEIIIKVKYKYFRDLTIIDTTGLIFPAPGRKNRMLQGKTRT